MNETFCGVQARPYDGQSQDESSVIRCNLQLELLMLLTLLRVLVSEVKVGYQPNHTSQQ